MFISRSSDRLFLYICIKQQIIMTTLSLKRKYKGDYEVEDARIKISLSNPFSSNGFGTNAWQLIIQNKISGEELLNEWFQTKKDASRFGAKWVLENY